MTPRSRRAAQQPTRRRSTVLTSALALTAAVTLSGCQGTSPLQTQKDYEPSDGVSATVGPVKLRNILVVSGKATGPGTLVAWADNPSTAPVTLTFTAGQNKPINLLVPAGGTASLSGQPDRLAALSSVTNPPGGLTPITISTGSAGSVPVEVPVLYPYENSPYRTLAPAGYTPAPKPAASTAPAVES
ncbi:MAG TPA: hypothetical protein VES01_10240 [Dermatophilaceae bacterium]|nr:hypothetical protein [Dermatophilaceae bacterium]